MGLFGYNAKDYNKNTAQIKERIEDLYKRATRIKGASGSGIGVILSHLARECDQYDFPKRADSKSVEAIDNRIFEVLDRMERDVQMGNIARLSAHADILNEAITDSRQWGKERYDSRYLENTEAKAQAMGNIFNALEEKAKLLEKIAEIKEEARLARDTGDAAALQKATIKFQALKEQESSCDQTVKVWQANYNAALKIEKEYKAGETIGEATTAPLASTQDLAKVIAKNNQKLAKHMGAIDTIHEITGEAFAERDELLGSSTSQSFSLLDELDQEDAINAEKNIASASVTGKSINQDVGGLSADWMD
jgi:hypothetical protein